MLATQCFILFAISNLARVITANPALSQDLHVQSDVLHLNINEPEQLGLFHAYKYMRCATEGFYGNPANCSHFYRCVDLTGNATQYQKFDFTCPNDAVFDEDLSICNRPAEVKPCTGSIAGLVGAINDDVPVDISRPAHPGTLLDEYGSPPPATAAPAVANVRCKKPGVFRSEDDCRRFYVCVDVFGDGTFFQLCEYPCPNEMIFSESDGHCVEPPQGETCIQVYPPPSTTPTTPTIITGYPVHPQTDPTTNPPPTGRPTTGTPPVPLPPIVPGPPCTSEGLFRHPLDCTKFYQCVDVSGNGTIKRFNRYDFRCAPGTVFDEVLGVCNHPHAVPGCGAVVIPTQVPVTTSTGYPIHHSSEAPLTFAPVVTHTTPPSPGTSSPTYPHTQTVPPAVTTIPPVTYPITHLPITSHPVTHYPVTPGPVIPLPPVTTGQPCASEGYFRYPDDCSKFYRCVDISGNGTSIKRFTRYDFQCGNGTVFDETLSICNHPVNVPGCGGSWVTHGTPWTQRPHVTYPTQTYPTHPRPTYPPGPIFPGLICQYEGFFRDPNDCTKFYQCVDVSGNGTQKRFNRYEFRCGSGSVFDESYGVCNHPHAVPGCSHVTFPPHPHPTAPPHPVHGGTTTQPPVTVPFVHGSVPFKPGTHIGTCSKAGYFRYPNDCSKFYHCIAPRSPEVVGYFIRHDYQCSKGNAFDEIKLVCTHPNVVPGCGSTRPPVTYPTIRPTYKPPRPGPGPVQPNPSWPYCHQEGFFHFPNDCTRFYQCVDVSGNGTTVKKFQRHDFRCGPGTVFDESLQVCNHPHAVPACAGTVIVTPTHTTHSPATRPTYPTQPATRPTYPTQPATRPTYPTPWPSSTTPPPRPTPGPVIPLPPVTGGTPCSIEGYFRYPDDCSKFYRCVDISGNGTFSKQYIRYDFQCGNGTVFDVSINVCNYPENVPGCGEGTSPIGPITARPTPVVHPGTTTWPVRPTGSPVYPVIPGPPCSREGVFRDPYDCNKFYQCVDVSGNITTQKRFNRYDFKCGPGTVFDESLSVCNHPHAVPGCSGSIATLPPIHHVTTVTYPPHPTPRPTGTAGTTTHAPYPTPTVATHPTYPEVTHPQPHPTHPVVTDPHPHPTYPGVTQRPRPPITSLPSSGPPCIKEGFFRYPENCAKFYYCLDVTGNRTIKQFVKYDYECAPGTVFDESLNVCNYPLAVPGCEHFVPVYPTPTHGSGTSTIPTPTGVIIVDPTDPTHVPVIVGTGDTFCKKEGFFRDPTDCSRFFRCAFTRINGTTKRLEKYEFHCAFGFVFDEREVICTNPDKVPECVDYLPPVTAPCPAVHVTDGTTHSHGSTDVTTATTEPSTTTSHFITTIGPIYTDPTPSTTTTTTTTTSRPIYIPPTPTTTTTSRPIYIPPTPSTTTTTSRPIYTVPHTSRPIYSTTTTSKPTQGTGHTHVPRPVSTVQPVGPPCTREGLWRNPNDCTKFYRCVAITDDGRVFKRFEFQCPQETVFDELNGVCNFPHATSPCPFGQGPTYPPHPPHPVHPTGGHSTLTPSHSTTPSTTTTAGHGSEILTHVCTEAGSFKDPNDCTKYFLCTDLTGNGTHFHMCEVPCPENSYFDESSQRCSRHVGRYSCKFDLSTVLDLLRYPSSDVLEQLANETQNHDQVSEDYFNQLKAQLNEFRNESAVFL